MSILNKELPKAYNAGEYEDGIYKKWEASGFFNPDACVKKKICNENAPVFSLMMPPPNVTGVLHLGHALENALMDTMARYQRMRGKRTLFLPGTDHAAVATQARVEKDLIDSGKYKNPRQELGREKLIEIIRDYAEDCKKTIISQIKKMGSSCDWSRLAYTFDEARSEAVNAMFKKMYDDGLIYRGYRVVNWSVRGQSTCSDDELEYVERQAKLYTFKYAKDFPISVATTRPETKLGDTAVAVHPDDKRYKKYIGKIFKVDIGAAKPLEIKIIADKAVEMEFGTGAVGVTPAHSQIDYEIFEKQKAKGDPIGLIPVIDQYGKMNENAGVDYQGLKVGEAREKFVEYLRKNNLLEKEEEITQNVGTSDRFKDAIEVLPMEQWFVSVNKNIPGKDKSLKDLMREAVTIGHNGDASQKIKITPERFEKSYLQWIENLRDWCISRQIWWGHRIPVWYRATNSQNNTKTKDNNQTPRNNNPTFVETSVGRQKITNNQNSNSKIWDLKIYGENTFLNLKNNLKTIETRAGKEKGADKDWSKFKVGNVINFSWVSEKDEKSLTSEKVTRQIKNIWHFDSIDEMLKKLDLNKIAPNHTAEQYKKEMENYPGFKERLKMFGVWAFELEEFRDTEIKIQAESPGEGWEQDPDTLDTWFSSGLWTFSTLGWPPSASAYAKASADKKATGGKPDKTDDLKTYHPTTWMQMGYEILFFWMARMILMSTYALDEIPFRDVYIHGILRNEQGKKFSKSDKTGTDPLIMIDKYGTDALRLSLLLGITSGNDARFYEEKIRGTRNFINKLWNISRYILTKSEILNSKSETNPNFQNSKLTLSDRWILSELNKTIRGATKAFEEYQFSRAGELLQEFTWTKLADWYLEIAKIEIGKEKILIYILTNLLKLLHPFAPFVTEQIWSSINDNLLMVEKWPVADEKMIDERAAAEFEKLQELVTAIRNLKAGKKIEPKEIVKVKITKKEYLGLVEGQRAVIERLGRCEVVEREARFEV